MKRKPVAPRPQVLDVDAIRARMKARREALGLSQWDITRAIGHSTNAWVSSFESGRRGRRVTMDMLARVAQVLRMTTEELTGEQPMPTRTVELDDEHSQTKVALDLQSKRLVRQDWTEDIVTGSERPSASHALS